MDSSIIMHNQICTVRNIVSKNSKFQSWPLRLDHCLFSFLNAIWCFSLFWRLLVAQFSKCDDIRGAGLGGIGGGQICKSGHLWEPTFTHDRHGPDLQHIFHKFTVISLIEFFGRRHILILVQESAPEKILILHLHGIFSSSVFFQFVWPLLGKVFQYFQYYVKLWHLCVFMWRWTEESLLKVVAFSDGKFWKFEADFDLVLSYERVIWSMGGMGGRRQSGRNNRTKPLLCPEHRGE